MNFFNQTWCYYPALLYGLALLIGTAVGLNSSLWLGIPALFLWVPLITRKSWLRLLLSIFVGIAGFYSVKVSYHFPDTPPQGLTGKGHLLISSLNTTHKHFGKFWQYKGTLKLFEHYKNIPITLLIPLKEEYTHPPANGNYIVEGRLKRSRNGGFFFIVHPDTPWFKETGSFSLAEIRFAAKQSVQKYIHHHISHSRSAKLLTGLATGEFDDRLMIFEFSRFGLQHLMAISGFHFGIVAYFLGLICRLLLPRYLMNWTLLCGLSLYFIFLGCTPSIMRSWTSALVFTFGQILAKESNGPNALGLGLLIVLIVDPLACEQMGFQFSFATTGAILVFYPIVKRWMDAVFLKRSLSTAFQMNRLNQYGYLTLNFFKASLTLTIAVAIIAFPMTLYFFQKFPILSLVYNLFFPFLVSLSMMMLMLAIMLAPLPLLSDFVHHINTRYTEFVLDFTSNIPTQYDVIFYSKNISSEVLGFYLCCVFSFGLYLNYKQKEDPYWHSELL